MSEDRQAARFEVRYGGAGDERDEFVNYLGFWEALDEDRDADIVLAWAGERVAGSVLFGPLDGRTWVYHLFVREDFRGQGVCALLAEAVGDAARETGLAVDGDFTDPRLRAAFLALAAA